MMSEKYHVYLMLYPNGMRYVGVTNNPERRYLHHEKYPNNKIIKEHYKVHGFEDVEQVIVDTFEDRYFAEKLEKHLVHIYSLQGICYNRQNNLQPKAIYNFFPNFERKPYSYKTQEPKVGKGDLNIKKLTKIGRHPIIVFKGICDGAGLNYVEMLEAVQNGRELTVTESKQIEHYLQQNGIHWQQLIKE